jgi:cysteine synthase A
VREGRGRTRIIAVDPHGSVYHSYYKTGEPKAEGSSIVEGVGIGRVPGNYDGSVLDDIIRIGDPDAVRMVYTLTRREGLFVGGCAGLVVAAAVAYVKSQRKSDEPLNIVAILSDTGRNYVSKLYNSEWLSSQNLPVPD